jgi:hypothetical protein
MVSSTALAWIGVKVGDSSKLVAAGLLLIVPVPIWPLLIWPLLMLPLLFGGGGGVWPLLFGGGGGVWPLLGCPLF